MIQSGHLMGRPPLQLNRSYPYDALSLGGRNEATGFHQTNWWVSGIVAAFGARAAI